MAVKVELHTHTKYSHDSLLNKWFYLIMLKLRNIHTVAITDHNEIKGAVEYREFLKKFNISVIVGEEIFTQSGEVIGLFLHNKIEPGLCVRETLLQIKNQGGLVYIPHPYDKKRYKTVLPEIELKKNLDLIDIIEIHNGRNIHASYSEQQLAIANKFPHVYQLVGSDAHTFIELGRNYNLMEEFSTKEEFLHHLKNVKHIKKECLKTAHEVTKLVRLITLFKKGNFNEIYRVINTRIRS